MPIDIADLIEEIREGGVNKLIMLSEEEKDCISNIEAKAICELLENNDDNPLLLEIWAKKSGRNFADLETALSSYKKKLLNNYVIDDQNYKSNSCNIVRSWLVANNSEENLKLAISLDVFVDQEEKQQLFLDFIQNSQNKKSFKDIEKLHLDLGLDEKNLVKSINFWLRKEKISVINYDDVRNLLSKENQDLTQRVLLAISLLRAEQQIDKALFLNFISQNTNQTLSKLLINSWLEINSLTLEDLKSLHESIDEIVKENLFKYWNNFDFADFNELFEIIGDNKKNKFLIVTSWFKEKGQGVEFEKLKSVLELIKSDNIYKEECKELASAWLETNSTYENFIKLSQSEIFFSPDDSPEIAKLFLHNRKNFSEKKISEVCKDLYENNETFQCNLFKKVLEQIIINNDSSDKDKIKSDALSFTKSLTKNENFVGIINAINSRIPFTEIEKSDIASQHLNIASRHLNARYKNIRDFFNQKSISEALTLNNLRQLKKTFGNSFDYQTRNLSDIFAYYDITQDLKSFKSLFKPNILSEILDSFAPNSERVYISKIELNKIREFSGYNQIFFSDLPKTKTLTDYLKSKVLKKFNEAKDLQVKDDYGLILFNAFQEQIIEEEEEVIANNPIGENLFSHEKILDSFISPNGLIVAIAKQFYDNKKVRINADDFLQKHLGEEFANQLKEGVRKDIQEKMLLVSFEEEYKTEISKIAAYTVLQNTLPQICKNKYFTEKPLFSEFLDQIVQDKPKCSISLSSCISFFGKNSEISNESETPKQNQKSFLRLFNRNSRISPER